MSASAQTDSTRSSNMSALKIVGIVLAVLVAWELVNDFVLGFLGGIFGPVWSFLSKTWQTPTWALLLVMFYLIYTSIRNRKHKE